MSDGPPPICKRGLRGWEPANDAAHAIWKDVPMGKAVKVEVKQPRNLGRHNLYWKACSLAADNMEEFPNAKALHKRTKIDLGIFEVLPPLKRGGKAAIEAGSTAFDKMTEAEFREFFDQAMALWSERLGVSIDVLLQEAQAA